MIIIINSKIKESKRKNFAAAYSHKKTKNKYLNFISGVAFWKTRERNFWGSSNF